MQQCNAKSTHILQSYSIKHKIFVHYFEYLKLNVFLSFVFLFVFVRKITCYKLRIICGVTQFHGKQILFCTREKPELRRMRIIKGSDNSQVPNIHATPAPCCEQGPLWSLILDLVPAPCCEPGPHWSHRNSFSLYIVCFPSLGIFIAMRYNTLQTCLSIQLAYIIKLHFFLLSFLHLILICHVDMG